MFIKICIYKNTAYLCKVSKAQNNEKTEIMKTQNTKLVKDMTIQEVKQELDFMMSKRNNSFDGGFSQSEYMRLISLHNRVLNNK
jgi:hypothetical protein